MVYEQSQSLDAIFSALSHPARRAILRRLGRSAATMGELAEPFDMSLPAVSKHLRALESAGLVTRRVEGRRHRIMLVRNRLDAATRWLQEHRRFWEARLDALDRLLDEQEPT